MPGPEVAVTTPWEAKLCREVARIPLDWLWPHYLPRGKLVILDGDPEMGKSLLTIDLIARLGRGGPLPDGSTPAGHVTSVLLSAEDDPADTIRPRAEAAGADLDRLVLPSFEHRHVIEKTVAVVGVRRGGIDLRIDPRTEPSQVAMALLRALLDRLLSALVHPLPGDAIERVVDGVLDEHLQPAVTDHLVDGVIASKPSAAAARTTRSRSRRMEGRSTSMPMSSSSRSRSRCCAT